MDENLINQTFEEYDITEDVGIEETDVPIEDVEQEISTEETVYDVSIEAEEDVSIDMSESMGWVGGDNRYHDSLLGIDFPRQHPIEAITNLREELDEIERLRTVYSDKFNVANYYEWKDAAYNIYGYFVSLVPGTSTIKLCDGANIFGVSVDDAGFIGGQDEEIPRDSSYGLIVTSGLVDVRCELDVEVGDHVVSNADGYAKKSGSDYGYRVLVRENKHGIEYAVIALGVQADVTNAIGVDLDEVKERVEVNEKNIISAINVANQAYNKAESASSSASVSKDAVEEALKEILGFGEKLDEVEKTVASSSVTSEQAKAIANAAAASAMSMKEEAVKAANEALGEASKLRGEFEDAATQMKTDLGDAALEISGLKEDLEPLALWPEGSDLESSTGYAGFVARANDDSSILGAMVGRKGEDGETLAGFIQEAEETRATVSGIASYQRTDKNGNPIPGEAGVAGLIAQVDANKANIEIVASFEGDGYEGLAGLVAQVDENKSNVAMISKRVEGKYVVVPELVDEDERIISNVYYSHDNNTSYWYHSNGQWNEVTRWNDIPDDHVDEEIVYYIPSDKLYWYYNYDAHAWNSTSDAYDAGLPSAIAGIQNKVDDNSASINSFTDWQGAANVAMARIEQKADANGAYIQSTVANIDKYSVGENSQAHGFTLEQAAEVLEEDQTYYIPIKQTTETYKRANEAIEMPDVVELEDLDASKVYYVDLTTRKYIYYGAYSDQSGYTWFKVDSFDDIPAYTRTFLPGYLYKWGRINGVGHYGWTTVDKDYATTKETSGADNTSNVNTSSQAVYFSNTEILLNKKDNNNNYGYWYTQVSDGDETIYDSDGNPTDKYQPYTLYKWDLAYKYKNEDDVDIKEYRWNAVDTLVGNSTGRAVSQIRQDANSIKAEIVSANGSVAGFGAWLSDTASEVQTLSTWAVDAEDGIKYNLATIKQKATDAESSITQVVESVGKDGKVNAASIVTAVANDTAAINMLADNITLTADQITLTGEDLSSFNATIGGWNIDKNKIYKDSTRILADDSVVDYSLVYDGVKMPIRLAVGVQYPTVELTYSDIQSNNGKVDVDITFDGGTITSVSVVYLGVPTYSLVYKDIRHTIHDDGTGFNIQGTSSDYQEIGNNYTGPCKLTVEITYIDTAASDPESTYNFRVLEDGSLYANAAEIKGTISANDGDIGGWTIEPSKIKKGNTILLADNSVTAQSLVGSNQSPVRIAVGTGSSSKPVPFRVLDDGSLYASAAEIAGKITAKSGRIGGLDVHENGNINVYGDTLGIYSGGIYDDDYWKFQAESLIHNGMRSVARIYSGDNNVITKTSIFKPKVSIEGEVLTYSARCNFSSTLGTNGKLCDYSVDVDALDLYFEKTVNNVTLSSTTTSSGSKQYSYSLTETIPDVYTITKVEVGSVLGHTFTGNIIINKNQVSISDRWVYQTANTQTTADVPLTIYYEAKGYIVSLKLTNNQLQVVGKCDVIDGSCDAGIGFVVSANIVYSQSYDALNVDQHSFLVLNDGSAYMRAAQISKELYFGSRYNYIGQNGSNPHLYGTWSASECLASGSDVRYKNSIEMFDERYYQFFKNLVPRRYKYNHGTSDRYHLGFVAQEVESALLDAGLTTQEVAAYVMQHIEGEDDGMRALRYEEFIALIVDALQRALKRIDALEAKYETQQPIEE